jgi:hypothetical protein
MQTLHDTRLFQDDMPEFRQLTPLEERIRSGTPNDSSNRLILMLRVD